MKIFEELEGQITRFEELQEGDFFLYDGCEMDILFMRTEDVDGWHAAVAVGYGTIEYFDNLDEVKKVSCSIEVE